MNVRELFMYDPQGFLKVENFLTSEEVHELNSAFDSNWDKPIPDPNSHEDGDMEGQPPAQISSLSLLAQLSALCRRRLRDELARLGAEVNTGSAGRPGAAVHLPPPVDRGRRRYRHSAYARESGRDDSALT